MKSELFVNPIGKVYTREQFLDRLEHFKTVQGYKIYPQMGRYSYKCWVVINYNIKNISIYELSEDGKFVYYINQFTFQTQGEVNTEDPNGNWGSNYPRVRFVKKRKKWNRTTQQYEEYIMEDSLHSIVLYCTDPEGYRRHRKAGDSIDHIDHNHFNCMPENLAWRPLAENLADKKSGSGAANRKNRKLWMNLEEIW